MQKNSDVHLYNSNVRNNVKRETLEETLQNKSDEIPDDEGKKDYKYYDFLGEVRNSKKNLLPVDITREKPKPILFQKIDLSNEQKDEYSYIPLSAKTSDTDKLKENDRTGENTENEESRLTGNLNTKSDLIVSGKIDVSYKPNKSLPLKTEKVIGSHEDSALPYSRKTDEIDREKSAEKTILSIITKNSTIKEGQISFLRRKRRKKNKKRTDYSKHNRYSSKPMTETKNDTSSFSLNTYPMLNVNESNSSSISNASKNTSIQKIQNITENTVMKSMSIDSSFKPTMFHNINEESLKAENTLILKPNIVQSAVSYVPLSLIYPILSSSLSSKPKHPAILNLKVKELKGDDTQERAPPPTPIVKLVQMRPITSIKTISHSSRRSSHFSSARSVSHTASKISSRKYYSSILSPSKTVSRLSSFTKSSTALVTTSLSLSSLIPLSSPHITPLSTISVLTTTSHLSFSSIPLSFSAVTPSGSILRNCKLCPSLYSAIANNTCQTLYGIVPSPNGPASFVSYKITFYVSCYNSQKMDYSKLQNISSELLNSINSQLSLLPIESIVKSISVLELQLKTSSITLLVSVYTPSVPLLAILAVEIKNVSTDPLETYNCSVKTNPTTVFEDIDECLLGLDTCTQDQQCVNVIGTFLCICKPGLIIDPFTCECGPTSCSCKNGLRCVAVANQDFCNVEPFLSDYKIATFVIMGAIFALVILMLTTCCYKRRWKTESNNSSRSISGN